ncbi:FkbM family methyltransferase [Pseudomonas sp. NMS19W]|uniref:FkbM family methyltransferase n=1 Tax=Pseudomonas sp. NMS19W TaxID=3079768 RepID=UPI003F658FFB
MNSIKRNGVEIEAAFSIASKRLRARAASHPVISAPTDVEIDVSSAASDIPHATSPAMSQILRHHIKQTLRRIAQSAFRATRPFTRPALFRLRNYLNATIRQDMLQEFATLQQSFATLQEQQREQTQQVMLELQRLTNATNVQASLSRELFASQLPVEKAGPQLDRIEQYALLDVNRIAINSGPDETLVKTAVGYMLCGARDHALLANLMEAGELEPGTRILIERIIKPGDVYIDVGANIGMHSIAAARAMSGQGRIFAFEPFEPTRKLLERNLWLNGFSSISEISHYALSDTAGSHKLHLGATSGHHSLYALETPTFAPTTSVDISTITLDEFLPADLTAKLLKIDAEGAEIDVMKGARRLLAANPQMLLIVELGRSHLKRNTISLENWLNHFTATGLVFSVINERTGALENWSTEQLLRTDSVNLLFHRPEWTHAERTDT